MSEKMKFGGHAYPLYILPGESRTKEDREYRPNCLKVTVKGEEEKIYPFILGCEFRPEWENIGVAANEMGLDLAESDPIKDEDGIGRSIIRSWIATADGNVYTCRRPGGMNMLITELLPIKLDTNWILSHTTSATV
jgi:hypothetical protein